MGIGVIVILALAALAAVGAVAVIELLVFTFIKLIDIINDLVKKSKDRVKKPKDRVKKSKVAFGNTKKVVNKNAKKILDEAPTMKMKDLEEMSEDENEYFIVNYDEDTDEVTDFTTIKAQEVEKKVENVLDDTDGIIVFE